MRLLTDAYLHLLGVGELLENAQAVLSDKLGLSKRQDGSSLAGKTAIVTGGNAGVGYATAEALLRNGATVVLACRSEERAAEAARRLAASVTDTAGGTAAGKAGKRGKSSMASDSATSISTAAGEAAAVAAGSAGGQRPTSAGAKPCNPGGVEVALLDLADLSSVRAFVRRWAASGRRLDLLVCNAGIMCPPERVETRDGFELQFQSNFLSHFCLANALVRHHQRLQQQQQQQQGRRHPAGGSSGSSAEAAGLLRVIWLSSMTHFGADLSDLGDVPYCRQRWHSFQAYCNSKLCTVLAAKHLDRLFARDAQRAAAAAGAGAGSSGTRPGQPRDCAVAVHPGLVDTYLARNYFKTGFGVPRRLQRFTDPFFDRVFCPWLLRSPEAAADTLLFAATAGPEEVGGQYCGTAPRVSRCSAAADDPALAQRLWDLSAHLCQLSEDELVS